MNETTLFKTAVLANADRILQELGAERKTAWDLKIKLHLTSSQLYIALGYLLSRGEIDLKPQDLSYIVKIAEKAVSVPPAPPVQN
ncbi:MAG: hypothetical protein WCS77_10635 [Elusimicrobiaceae bacterium]|jgi:hypothetical protein